MLRFACFAVSPSLHMPIREERILKEVIMTRVRGNITIIMDIQLMTITIWMETVLWTVLTILKTKQEIILL